PSHPVCDRDLANPVRPDHTCAGRSTTVCLAADHCVGVRHRPGVPAAVFRTPSLSSGAPVRGAARPVADRPMRVPFIRWRFRGGESSLTSQGYGVVRPLPGDGVVAHVGGLMLVCQAGDAVESLLAALHETASSGGDGLALARRVAQALAGTMTGGVPACAVA